MVWHFQPQQLTTQHSTAQNSTAQHNPTQHNPTQHSTTRHSTTQYSTTQHSTAQLNTAQHRTEQHNTTQLQKLTGMSARRTEGEEESLDGVIVCGYFQQRYCLHKVLQSCKQQGKKTNSNLRKTKQKQKNPLEV